MKSDRNGSDRNVPTKLSHDRNGPDRNDLTEKARPTRHDRIGQTESAVPADIHISRIFRSNVEFGPQQFLSPDSRVG